MASCGNNNNYYNGDREQCAEFFNGAGNANAACRTRFGNKDANQNDRDVIESAIDEAICLYGQQISYYVHTYSLSGADNIYGEHTTTSYWPPKEMTMYIELAENAVTLSRFGFESDDSITAYVTYTTFERTFSGDEIFTGGTSGIPTRLFPVEPKADDVLQLIEYGNDRPGERNGKFFIVTEVLDQDIAQINPLGGHYMWMIKAKRHEYTFEPGLSGEGGNDQVHDDSFYGRLSAFDPTEPLSGMVIDPRTDNNYEDDADNISRDKVYDQDNVDNSVYGDYN